MVGQSKLMPGQMAGSGYTSDNDVTRKSHEQQLITKKCLAMHSNYHSLGKISG